MSVMDDYLCITVMSLPGEGKADFAARLSEFWTHMLPGITINTGPGDYRPIEHMRLVQFDGRTWQPIGDVIESAFSTSGTSKPPK